MGDVDPNDIHQGLSTGYFCSALSCAAENPKIIERLFVTKEYNEEGVYKIRLCKNGQWVVVTVDDYIPCYPDGGPCFAKTSSPNMWVTLLQKAFAKLVGNYHLLNGISFQSVMRDMTGCPTEFHQWEDTEDIDYDEIWEKIVTQSESGHLIVAGTKIFANYGKEDKRAHSGGLFGGHTYTVVKAIQYEGYRLLNLRNPFGKDDKGNSVGEWNGDWSDTSELWEDVPHIKEVMQPVFDLYDGNFWMSLEDFLSHFDTVGACKVEELFECRLKGKFLKVYEKKVKERDWVLSKFFYKLNVPEHSGDSVPVTIGIHQEDEADFAVRETRPYMDVGCVVLRQEDGELTFQGMHEPARERDVETTFDLEPGDYIIVPRTSGGYFSTPPGLKLWSHLEHYSVDENGVTIVNPLIRSMLNNIF